MIDMWPEAFLVGNLKSMGIFTHYGVDDSFVFEEIQTACRIEHLSSYFQSYYGSIEEFFLETCDSFYIFYMPVFCRVSTFIESSFTTTRSIEKDAVEYFRSMSEVLSRIQGDSDICTAHAIEILEKLWDAFTSRLVGDDEAIWIVLCELCGLTSWTRRHIEYGV